MTMNSTEIIKIGRLEKIDLTLGGIIGPIELNGNKEQQI